MDMPEAEHPRRAEDRFAVESFGAARRHVMTPHQKVTHAFVDVIVDRAVCGQSGAVAEVSGPTAQQAVQPISHFRPCSYVARHQQIADLGLEPENALLRRARPEIPMAVLAIAVRAERIAKKVEGFAPGIPNRGLRLSGLTRSRKCTRCSAAAIPMW